MPYVKNKSYCDMPFSSETHKEDFYVYASVTDLLAKSRSLPNEIIRCRTVGILQSINGHFYLSDMNLPINEAKDSMICISTMSLKSPPKSTIIPYTVQLFGTLQWKGGPVIFAKILQPVTTTMATMLHETLSRVARTHLARCSHKEDNGTHNSSSETELPLS